MTKETVSNLVEVCASFAFKLNVGNYESRDFFCSQKVQCPAEEAEAAYDRVYGFCRRQVMKSVKLHQEETGERDGGGY